MIGAMWSASRASSSANARVLCTSLLALGLSACQQQPQQFVDSLEIAMASGDADRIAAHLTADSRPMFRAMMAVSATDGGDKAPFRIIASRQHATIERVVPIEDGVLISLKAGDLSRKWVLTRRGSKYLLDLAATATRRPWGGI